MIHAHSLCKQIGSSASLRHLDVQKAPVILFTEILVYRCWKNFFLICLFLAAMGVHCFVQSFCSCGVQASHCSDFFRCGAGF